MEKHLLVVTIAARILPQLPKVEMIGEAEELLDTTRFAERYYRRGVLSQTQYDRQLDEVLERMQRLASLV